MNKNVKRIVALALAFGTVAAVAPATHSNLLITKAYASSTNDDETLDSLKLETSGGSSIKLYSDDDYDSDHRVKDDDVSKGDTYYAKTSANTIQISTSGVSSSYIRVFKGTSSSTKGKSVSSDISLSSSSTNTITVKIYSKRPDSDVRYDDNSDVLSKYVIKVKCTSDSDSGSTSASDYDNIYLDKLKVDGQSIGLSTSQIEYSYSVATNVNSVTLQAEPEHNGDIVKVNDNKVYEGDDYKTKVNLKVGVNEFKIRVEDDDNDDYRIYTLKITRAEPPVIVADKWVPVNGRWTYNDSSGVPLKSTLFNDRTSNKTYYLQADGFMATGWVNYNGWRYFGLDGAMMTGWIIDGGKYYYLQADGVMAKDTKIGQYRVGSDGAWIQ